MHHDESAWFLRLESKGALWRYDGDPKHPHALLTSGLHSDEAVNIDKVTQDPWTVEDIAKGLLVRAKKSGLDIRLVDRVVAPAMGAVVIGSMIAIHIAKERNRRCFFSYASKRSARTSILWRLFGVKPRKWMVFDRLPVQRMERVLLCDDARTTDGSLKLLNNAVLKEGGIVLPYELVVFDRSGLSQVGARKVVSLISRPMSTWKPKKCPLCLEGSLAIRPKDPLSNWELLTGRG